AREPTFKMSRLPMSKPKNCENTRRRCKHLLLFSKIDTSRRKVQSQMMTEPRPNDDTLLSPSEAVEWLKVHRGETAMTVNILRQMRHRGAYERCNWAARTVESRS